MKSKVKLLSIYLSGYYPNCGYSLKEWFEAREGVLKNGRSKIIGSIERVARD